MSASNITHPEDPHPQPPSSSSSRSSNDHDAAWLFTTNTPSASSQISQQMIGPTSTFYDPENVSLTQDTPSQDYQSWLDSYRHSQEHQPQQLSSSAFHTQLQLPSLMQNQFQFVSGQYTPPASNIGLDHSSDYPTTPVTATPSNVPTTNTNASSLHGAVSYQHPELYFYSSNDVVSDHSQPQSQSQSRSTSYEQYNSRSSSDPTSATSALFTPPPSSAVYSPSNVQTPSSASGLTYAQSSSTKSATYNGSPDLLSLPAPYSRSHSHSLSPTSWAEESKYGNSASASQSGPPLPAKSASNTTTRSPPKASPASRKTAKVTRTSSPPQKGKRKRQKKNDAGERDSDSVSDDDQEVFEGGGLSSVIGGSGSMGGPDPVVPTRLQGACTVCKRLKMKCDFPKDENTCKRCKAGGHVCVVEGRKPRTAPNKREYLMAQIRQKDSIIESLLKQLHNPYRATPLSLASYRMATSPSDQNNRNVNAWLDRLQSSVRTAGGKGVPGAFKPESRARGDTHNDDDSDGASEHPYHFSFGGDDNNDLLDGIEESAPDPDKLQSLPDAAVPLGLIANLSLSNSKARHGGRSKPKQDGGDTASSDNLDDDNVGVANETYFMPGPASDLTIRASLIGQHSPPDILVHGLVVAADVDKLFDIFYTRVNPFVSLLDPELHTPASTFARCPFLFTVICAISSRYYTEKSEIYPIAMHFAKHSAANALIDGWKSVELCQAYILMSIYAVPARKWEEDRSWLYTGLAIRIATDLNLHQVSTTKPQNERQEREVLNKTRVWIICFNLDRSTATQFGKPVSIKEDYIIRNSKDWYKKSQYNHPYDVHMCAYASLLRIVARFHDDIYSDPTSTTGLNRQVNFRAVTLMHDDHLSQFHDEWAEIFARDSDPNDHGSAFRCTLLPFLVGYSRLVMYSFGFQQAFQRGIEPGDHILFTKCLDAAKSVVKNFVEVLAPSGYMRFAPDGHFIFASFASAFLLKLLRPDFSNLLTKHQDGEIFAMIGRLIQTLSSPEIAIDDRHTPRLYARFLAGLLTRHRRDGASAGRQHPPPPPQNPISRPSQEDYNASSSSNSIYSTTRHQGGGSQTQQQQQQQQQHDSGYAQSLYNESEKADSAIYQAEATYPSSTDPTDVDMSVDLGFINSLSEEDMLATMQALKNPAWWQTMMMPGFSWPEPQPMMKNDGYSINNNNRPAFYNQNANVMGMHNGFGGFLAPEVSLR